MSDKHVVGAQLYTLREFTKTIGDAAQTLKKVAKIGYKAVQISGFGPMDYKDVAKAVQDAGVVVAATHMGWPRFQNELDQVIAEHKAWGCKHAAIGGLPGEYFNYDGVKRFAEQVAPIAQRLAKEGMDFSYHNHSHELVKYNGKHWLAWAYELTDSKFVKAEIDTFWIQTGGGSPATWIRKYPGRQPLLHLKDMTYVNSTEPGKRAEARMAEVGEGNLDWPDILKAAKEVGVEWYLVEQDNCYGRDPFESLAISYRNLNAMGLK